jgi:octaprenyl-diphosphate synthase
VQTSAPAAALPVSGELELIERRLAEMLRSREPRLSEIADYLIASGGKRVRPAVVVLVYRACGGTDAGLCDVVDVAVALELIHSASLLHDDIIDGSALRRGRDSALRRFGLAETLVAGDFLFGQAYHLCARFEEKLIRWAVDACISLTEGEIMQGRFRHNPAVTLTDYLEIVTRKTASLFAAGARTAAHLAGAVGPVVESMARAGHHVGIAFQMIDDVLDVSGTEAQLGKPIGIDLREGNPSLPVVLALTREGRAGGLFAQPSLTDEEFHALLECVRHASVIETACRMAGEHAAHAGAELATLPDSPYQRSLLWLVEQLTRRAA